MSNKRVKNEIDEVQQEAESKYPRRELILAAKAAFNVKPEIVAGALTLAAPGQEEFTKTEVEDLITKFKEREV